MSSFRPSGWSGGKHTQTELMGIIASLYESEWQHALDGAPPPPALETLVGRLEEYERETLRAELVRIEHQYRPRWSSGGSEQGAGATIAPTLPPRQVPPTSPPTPKLPEDEQAIDETIDVATEPTRPSDGDAAPQVTATYESRPSPTPSDDTQRQETTRRDAVPGYEIEGELGRGGMGVVYRARQVGLNRHVALKMILAGSHAEPEQLARFQAEAEAVAQLQHPNIVQVYDVGECEGMPFFSLELIEGDSLEGVREGKPMVPARAAEIVEMLAHAMHYAHQQGIVHRDLKPGNVLLNREGIPKVTDFGLVKRLEGDSSQTRTGAIMGTPSYMAPEQAKGDKRIGPLADVYSLGAVLYCLLTGRPPFLAANPIDTVGQLLNNEPVPPSRLQSTVPRDLETICLKCLQKSPERRYDDAEALAEDLRRFQVGEPIQARPVGAAERIWSWCRRNPRIAIPTAAAVLLALALAVGGPTATYLVYEQKELAEASALEAMKNEEKSRRASERATASQKVAEKNELKAIDAQEVAEENERKATDAQKVAAAQGRFALDTLDTLIRDVQDELADRPRLQSFRRMLLGKAVGGLDQVAAKGIDVGRKDLLTAGACRRLGDIYLELGESDRALEQFQLCHTAVEQLIKDGALPNSHHNLSLSLSNLGESALRSSKPELAKDYFQKALDVRRDWAQAQPDNHYIPQNVASTLGRLGSVCLMQGHIEEAQHFFGESHELRQQWIEVDPQNVDAQLELAGSHASLGKVAVRLGNLREAEQFARGAFDVLWKLHQQQPKNREHLWNSGLFAEQLATAHLMADNPQQAKVEYARALSILKPLVEDDPDNARLRRNVAKVHYEMGTACLQAADSAAQEHFQESLELRQALRKDDPNSPAIQIAVMLSSGRCGKHEEAAKLAAQLREAHSTDPHVLYFVATGFSVCAAATLPTSSDSSSDTTSMALHETYGNEAVATLQMAIEHGYQVTAELDLDPDLDAVRELADFQALLEKYKQEVSEHDG